jgi:hypothetical protein
MSITQNFKFREDPEFRADLGDYREIKVKGIVDEVHGVRIARGEVWDMDHLIPHGLALDGFVFLRHERIIVELNADRYDKVDFLLSLAEMPDVPETLPVLDSNRELFEWLRDEGKLLMVFLPGQRDSIMGKVEAVGDQSCGMRLLNDELEVTEDLVKLTYDKIHVLVVGTHLLRMFEKYLEAMGLA